MTTLLEAFTEELQLWLGETATITPFDVTNMLTTAQTKMVQTVRPVAINIEGDPQDVALVTVMLKQILPVSEKKADHSRLDDGRIRRELKISGRVEEKTTARPGNLNPQNLAERQSAPEKPSSASSDDLIYEALKTLARGLLEFSIDDDGRRKFGGAYPATFKNGISQLNAYFLTKGVTISDSLEYWRLLSKPLKDWPAMPPHLQSPDPFIDYDGRTTILTEYLAR